MAGRKKIQRKLEVDATCMDCVCFGPLKIDCSKLDSKQKIQLYTDEYQTLIYQDIENLTMDEACKKMGISKTVYAGLYKTARQKCTLLLQQGCVLTICNS